MNDVVNEAMSNELSEDRDEEEGFDGPRLSWELPEVVAIAILVAVVLVILGGLVTGIAAAAGTSSTVNPVQTSLTGTFIVAGAEWAEPVFVLLLLAVLGLCWWQIQGWKDSVEDNPDQDQGEAVGHMARARHIVFVTQIGLAITLAGSIANFVGAVMAATQPPHVALVWSRAIYIGASATGVIVMASAGFWAGWELNAKARLPTPDPSEV